MKVKKNGCCELKVNFFPWHFHHLFLELSLLFQTEKKNEEIYLGY